MDLESLRQAAADRDQRALAKRAEAERREEQDRKSRELFNAAALEVRRCHVDTRPSLRLLKCGPAPAPDVGIFLVLRSHLASVGQLDRLEQIKCVEARCLEQTTDLDVAWWKQAIVSCCDLILDADCGDWAGIATGLLDYQRPNRRM